MGAPRACGGEEGHPLAGAWSGPAAAPHLPVAPLEDHGEGAVPNQVLARELELAHGLQAAAAGLHGAGWRLRRRLGPGVAGGGRAPSGRPGPPPAPRATRGALAARGADPDSSPAATPTEIRAPARTPTGKQKSRGRRAPGPETPAQAQCAPRGGGAGGGTWSGGRSQWAAEQAAGRGRSGAGPCRGGAGPALDSPPWSGAGGGEAHAATVPHVPWLPPRLYTAALIPGRGLCTPGLGTAENKPGCFRAVAFYFYYFFFSRLHTPGPRRLRCLSSRP